MIRVSESERLRRVRLAMERCILANRTISVTNLYAAGAKYTHQQIRTFRDGLIESGAITVPPDLMPQGTGRHAHQGAEKTRQTQTDDDIRALTLAAMRAAHAAGRSPGIETLRLFGAKGDNHRILRARDELIAGGEPVCTSRHTRMHLPDGISRPRPSVHPRRDAQAVVRCPRPVRADAGPCRAELESYWRAWRRIRRRGA